MLDPAQSSAIPRRTLAGEIPQPPEADQSSLPEGLSRSTKTDESRYSIRLAESPGTLCAACGKQETGDGPVGYLDEEPVCDLCLLESTIDLGLILALVSVTLAYASIGAGASQGHRDALVCAFARIYHRIASKSWPHLSYSRSHGPRRYHALNRTARGDPVPSCPHQALG